MRGKLYVPILWAKEGEFGALKRLTPSVKERLLPFFEVPPPPWDYTKDQPAKTLDAHLKKLVPKIQAAWGSDEPAFIDFEWIPETERVVDDKHFVTSVFDAARKVDLKLIPVVTLTRESDYLDAVLSVVRQDKRGFCIRVVVDDLVDGNLLQSLRQLLNKLGAGPSDADLLIDVKDLKGDRLEAISRDFTRAVSRIPFLETWRSFAVAATGFPDSLAGLPKLNMSKIRRTEWELWQHLNGLRGLRRQPIFGDYGIGSPAHPDVDPRVMQPSAAIRYTADDDWVVVKGKNLRDHGYDQFHDVCRALVGSKIYRGRTFSWGDRYIHECAQRQAGRGNLTTWRAVGTSHHLTFVVGQIANAS